MNIIMSSCMERHALREGTLQNLSDVGLDVTALSLARCEPGNFVRHTRQNAGLLLQAIADGGPVLSVEDDIEIKPEINAWLAVAQRENVIITFSTAHPRFETHIPEGATPGLYALPQELVWMGAMCVYFPVRVLLPLAAAASVSSKGWDTTVDRWMREAGERIYVAYPNPVQHLDPKTTFERLRDYGPRDRTSKSYEKSATIKEILEAELQ